MSEHLSKETVAGLLSRQLAPDEVLAASRHLSFCSECRQQLGDAKNLTGLAKSVANDLQGSTRTADPHLNYEHLESYVDEKLAPAERELVGEHLATCDSCAQEVKELLFLRENLSSYPQVASAGAAAPAPQRGTAFERFAALFRAPSWQLAGLAALLLLALIVGLLLWQTRKPSQLANGNRDGQTRDGQTNGPDNSSHGPENRNTPDEAQKEPGKEENNPGDASKSAYDALVATAIARQALATPSGLKELTGRPVTLLGPGDPTENFDLLSPRGTVVESSRPTLRWRALAGAENYQVYLLNTNFDVVQKSGPLTLKSWTVPQPLERGQTYVWQVVATKEGKEIPAPVAPARDARFKVLDAKSQSAIRGFGKDNSENHLALGIVLAHYGLLDEAERELASAATSKQSPELARKFLRDVKAMRR